MKFGKGVMESQIRVLGPFLHRIGRYPTVSNVARIIVTKLRGR